jgi:DNA-binding beta-propeller fold protein YncE
MNQIMEIGIDESQAAAPLDRWPGGGDGLGARSWIRTRLRSNVVGYLALFVAMSATAVALPATNPADAAAATGDLLQKPGAAGCLSVIGFCERGDALEGAQAITVSPDGQNAYVAAENSDAVAVFDRAGDGTLIQKRGRAGCISDTGAGRCRDGTALDVFAGDGAALSVAVSPDEKSAYVA